MVDVNTKTNLPWNIHWYFWNSVELVRDDERLRGTQERSNEIKPVLTRCVAV